ncbi:hypothetical protein ACFUJU_28725 [Streptomyces sp. NPDC057235]|uniref:phage tail assembly protein T n=1 Tax=Streptomyces sp. NPDC057235 TaxID=3346058 RepID=UPI0036380B7A
MTGPLGGERLDVLNAILAATVANTARGKGQSAREPREFLPRWEQGTSGQSTEQMIATVKTLTVQMGGTDLREAR